jgi:hypothetical protein
MRKFLILLLSVITVASAATSVLTASAAPVEPVVLLEGEDLLPDRNRHSDYKYISDCSGVLDADTGIVRLTASDSDPYYWLLPKNTTVAPVMVIKYRTEAIGTMGKIYAASHSAISERNSFHVAYVADGAWRLLMVDIPLWLAEYDMDTNVLDHLRYDFINGAKPGQWMEVEYVAFFHTEDDALAYEDFRVNGEMEEESTAMETETPEAGTAETDGVEDQIVETTEEIPSETDPEPTPAGCKSVIASAAILSVVTLAAGIVIHKKSRSRTEIK